MRALKAICILASLAWLAVLPVTASAHGLDDILSAKTIVVGINPNLPPLGRFNDQNQIEGFDVDLANKLGEMLGVQISIVQVNVSADRVPFLATGKADIVLGALTVHARSCQGHRLHGSDPDRGDQRDHSEGQALSDHGGPELAGCPSIEVRGTTPVEYVKTNLSKAEVTLLDNYPDAVRALFQGRGDHRRCG